MITQNGAIKAYDMDTKYMRIIAACFVVLLYSWGMSSTAAVFLNAISRFSVPVFVITCIFLPLYYTFLAKMPPKKNTVTPFF